MGCTGERSSVGSSQTEKFLSDGWGLCTEGKTNPLGCRSADEKPLCVWAHINTNISRISPPREPRLAGKFCRLHPALGWQQPTESLNQLMFLMMKLLLAYWGRASSAARQLSLGVTRTVSSENPWDLALIVTGMAPSVGFFSGSISTALCHRSRTGLY